MKLIITTLGSYLTGDSIADALLDYSRALARAQTTDLVDIPVIADRTTSQLRLTVGWLMQLHALDAVSDQPELLAPATTTALRTQTAQCLDPWLEDGDIFEYGL